MPAPTAYSAYAGAEDTVSAMDAAEVTPDNSNDLARPARALYIGDDGNLHVLMASGAEVTFAAVPVGIFPIQVKRVYSTGTTAASIVALY